ncbi:hypothetical protein AVEN_119450-1 [Araneus ventricosus]|uniref:Uncharacterized protein n=1 Tax=Araneus ventricosus TaxID=182803 RepID=A0A4Y2DNK7_ARAVE|nr:hypothetical protein AVEN_119450-1 [Araneus ventricosus]
MLFNVSQCYGANFIVGDIRALPEDLGYHISNTRKAQPFNHVYKINNLVSSRSDSVTDLGIILDAKLDFSQHIDSMVSKAYRRLGILKRKTREFSSEIALKVLYYDHVRSSLGYLNNIQCEVFFVV